MLVFYPGFVISKFQFQKQHQCYKRRRFLSHFAENLSYEVVAECFSNLTFETESLISK